jgi:hypothetical protein
MLSGFRGAAKKLSFANGYAAVRILDDDERHALMPTQRLKQTFLYLFNIRVDGVGFEPYSWRRFLPQIPLFSPGLKIISAYYKRESFQCFTE